MFDSHSSRVAFLLEIYHYQSHNGAELWTVSLCPHPNFGFQVCFGWHGSLDRETRKYNLAPNVCRIFQLGRLSMTCVQHTNVEALSSLINQWQLVNFIKFTKVIRTLTHAHSTNTRNLTWKQIYVNTYI